MVLLKILHYTVEDRCLFHEVWDTTEYTEWRTHIYSNRLADLPAVDSRISPEMLVHSRRPQYLAYISYLIFACM
jgi:hypothetical protein